MPNKIPNSAVYVGPSVKRGRNEVEPRQPNNCSTVKYFAFRERYLYLTALPSYPYLVWTSDAMDESGPFLNQLFEGIDNGDGTWSFKAHNGQYISYYIQQINNGNNVGFEYYNFIGEFEKFVVERHGNHIHIKCNKDNSYYWFNKDEFFLIPNENGGSNLIMEYFSERQWGIAP